MFFPMIVSAGKYSALLRKSKNKVYENNAFIDFIFVTYISFCFFVHFRILQI